MENTMVGIGAMASASGLSVSALRFYDGAGILVPQWVDPFTGYRRYGEDQVVVAALIARLRRVDLPLAQIRRLLEVRDDPDAAIELIDAHLHRLEAGLANARVELSTVKDHLIKESSMHQTITTTAARLTTALRTVRYAAGSNPAYPMLGGVLIDIHDGTATVAATDRYRMAVSSFPVEGTVTMRGLAPTSYVDELTDGLADAGEISLGIENGRIEVNAGSDRFADTLLDLPFPDYQRLIDVPTSRSVELDGARLREHIRAAPAATELREEDGVEFAVAVLRIDASGQLSTQSDPAELEVGVNADFLIEAIDAGGPGTVVLGLEDPLQPLTLRHRDRPGTLALVMPTRLQAPATAAG